MANIVVNNGEHMLADPYTAVVYLPQIPTEVISINEWLKAQIEFGLFIDASTKAEVKPKAAKAEA